MNSIQKHNMHPDSFSQDSQDALPSTHEPLGSKNTNCLISLICMLSLLRHLQNKKRPSRTSKINYADLEDSNSQSGDLDSEEESVQESYDFLKPKIECLLWRRGQDTEKQQFLAKFINRSYLRVQWLTKNQLSQFNYQITASKLKSLTIKMNKVAQLKLGPNSYFNLNYLLPDRILTSTEVFSAIHHKRANDIKGKWEESLLLVCEKLLNLVKDGYPYGVIFHQPYNEQLQKYQNTVSNTSIGQILNKVYLGYFKKSWQFWVQLGMAINSYLKIFKENTGDYHKMGLVIRDCAVFLYQQWHCLTSQRYQVFRNVFFQRNLETPSTEPRGQTLKQSVSSPILQELCSKNILMQEKNADLPRTQIDLQLLNPGSFSLRWLQEDNCEQAYCFNFITCSDMRNLDLNVEIDKLYLVKWQDLSYAHATWQAQKAINSATHIENFKLWNKIPVRETRQKLQTHDKLHSILLEYHQKSSDKVNNAPQEHIAKIQNKLYLLNTCAKNAPKDYDPQDAPIYKNYRKLKDFQLQSLNWLIRSWYQGKNTILADQMGLGKTIQTIAFLYHLYTFEGVTGPFLVLAPLTTLQQWRRQIEEWTNFNCLLYYDEGKAAVREIIRQYEFYHLHTTKSGDIIPSRMPKFQILLTNYELFLNDFEILKSIAFQHIVLDEAHRLKNRNTKTTITLSQLPCPRKTLLTGTPIQNNTRELWTLLNFIEPKQFPDENAFMKTFGNLNTEEEVKSFKKMLKPYLLRRVKEDVQSSIPQLSETIIDVEMSSLQKTYYRGIIQKNKVSILKSLSSANFNCISMQLRKCCNHPYLISQATEAEIKAQARNAQEQLQLFAKSSGKMLLLLKLLQKFKKQSRKVLLFSQFVIMLDLIKPHLERRGYICEILKGSQSSVSRNQAIARFNHQNTDIFLISTKAGGVGINLISATEIIIYDSDWNPQNDIQATARAHRIGQKKEVTVYRLITANSYESNMFQLSSKKMGLNMAVFSGATFKTMQQFDDTEKQLSKNEIELLLKRGIVGFLQNKVDQQQYFNQRIQDILQKNGRKVQYMANKNSCVFSKTKFKSEEANNIQIDAPDFWQQALKGIQTPVQKLISKTNNLKQYSSVPTQQQLMLETYHIVHNFVNEKTNSTNFNAQDERHLLRLLENITSQRHFDRHFRDIADSLSLEIIKPSRRFKVAEQDIRLRHTETTPLRLKQTRYKSAILQPLQSNIQEEVQMSEQADSSPSQVSQAQKQQEEHLQHKQQEIEVPQKVQQKSNRRYQEPCTVIDQDFFKLCHLCQRLKCTFFCSGECGRSFHQTCYQLFNLNQLTKPQIESLCQLSQPLQLWKQAKRTQVKCNSCQQQKYHFQCCICLKEGLYLKEQKTAKKKKKTQDKLDLHLDTNRIYKCSAPSKCSKFYHLACLFTEQFSLKFADSMGRKIKSLEIPSPIFRCPAHYCFQCYPVDPKSTKSRSYCCIRCCKSYHDKCLPADKFLRLGRDHIYICAEHLQQADSVSHMIEDIKKMKPTKRDRILQKIKNKEISRKKQNTYNATMQQITEEHQLCPIEAEEIGLRRSKRITKDQQVHQIGQYAQAPIYTLQGQFNLKIQAQAMRPKRSRLSSSKDTSSQSNCASQINWTSSHNGNEVLTDM